MVKATGTWRRLESIRTESAEVRRDEEKRVPLQNKSVKPILLGADVVALYPSIDAVAGAQLVSEAILRSNVSFEGIDFDWLSVYLYVVIGEEKFPFIVTKQ